MFKLKECVHISLSCDVRMEREIRVVLISQINNMDTIKIIDPKILGKSRNPTLDGPKTDKFGVWNQIEPDFCSEFKNNLPSDFLTDVN